MSRATWASLYLLGLVGLAIRYRLGSGPATWILLLPVALMLFPLQPPRAWRAAGGAVALAGAVLLGRALGLGPWDFTRIDLALLAAAVGVGSLLTVVDEAPETLGLPVVAGWFLAAFTPLGPWYAVGAWALVRGWGEEDEAAPTTQALQPAALRGTLLGIGLLLAKPLWNEGAGAWGPWGVAWMAFGATLAAGFPFRPSPALTLPLAFLLHPWLPLPLGGVVGGLAVGWAWLGLPKPWPRAALGLLLLGMLLSYALHANLQLPGASWILLGSR